MFEPFNGTFAVDEIESSIDVDAVIIGVPFEDKIDFYQEGASKGAEVIRASSQFFSGQGLTKKSIHQLNVLDFGDIQNKESYEELQDELASKIKLILDKQAIPIIIGGDHSIALGTAKGVQKSNKKIDAIVWIDAHFDLMNEYPENNRYTRATVLKRILELNLIEPSKLFFIGSRGHNLGFEEIEFIEKNNIAMLNIKDVSIKEKREKFLHEIIQNHKSIYLSLDIDVLDPAFAPGVSVPEPGGMNSRELFEIIELLAKNTLCFEIVEVNPTLDVNDLTAKTACKAIFHFCDAMK